MWGFFMILFTSGIPEWPGRRFRQNVTPLVGVVPALVHYSILRHSALKPTGTPESSPRAASHQGSSEPNQRVWGHRFRRFPQIQKEGKRPAAASESVLICTTQLLTSEMCARCANSRWPGDLCTPKGLSITAQGRDHRSRTLGNEARGTQPLQAQGFQGGRHSLVIALRLGRLVRILWVEAWPPLWLAVRFGAGCFGPRVDFW